ncbi:MAG: BTAD domain-containing putative transcriptional regulator [Bacteroidota bacterium]
MKLNEAMDIAYQELIEQAENSPVLLLHPKSRYRSILVAMLVNDDDVNTFYYSLGPDDINLRAFIESLLHEMVNQHSTFGRHINLLSPNVFDNLANNENMSQLLEKFTLELSELGDDPVLFILDEYDRSDDADDIHTFIERLADVLPESCHLVLNSRTLPRLPWVAMIAKNRAALLLDDQLIQEDFYNNKRDEAYDLEVFALGPGIVNYKGEQIKSWEGHLPRLLFFFALDKPIVTRSEICSAFWPDLPIDQAVNVFHVTKRRLHKALGADVLVHNDTYYQVNPELNVYHDVLDFVETLMRSRNPDNPNPFDDWQHAAQLYRGPFLQGHNDSWILERRNAFRIGYLEALTNMASAWIEKDRKELALKLYLQALDEDNTREDIHRQTMQLYVDLGRRSEAIAHYQDLEKSFGEQKRDISEETTALYSTIVN